LNNLQNFRVPISLVEFALRNDLSSKKDNEEKVRNKKNLTEINLNVFHKTLLFLRKVKNEPYFLQKVKAKKRCIKELCVTRAAVTTMAAAAAAAAAAALVAAPAAPAAAHASHFRSAHTNEGKLQSLSFLNLKKLLFVLQTM